MRMIRRLSCSALFAAALAGRVLLAAPPLSPEESLAAIRLAPGLRVELVAAEPEVVDPVAIRFDEDARLWVVEMRDYPEGPSAGQTPQSRIRVLEDADGDGRYDTAQTFAEGLVMPTGLQPWKGGVFVTLAGRLAYLKDTDGDGRADLDETWFTGFAQENEQLRANHPKLALDGSIYVASGLRGGIVRNARSGEERAVNLRSADFRFDPRSGEWDTAAGNSQFGLTFDDFGRRFLCENRHPLRHVVIEERYLRRNPLLAVPAVFENVAPSDTASRVWPLTRQWTTAGAHAGQFTAACGVEIYRGDALPAEYYGQAFTCEPTGSLVHCEKLRPHGATFRSEPMFADREFLASTDEWFRPVNLEHGPDGALYVVDMYREVIEHPHWMPEEMKSRLNFRAGDDKGRIYRVLAENAEIKPELRRPRLSQATPRELAQTLADANSWRRDTAFRLLVERQDNSAADTLRQLLASIGSPIRPAARPAARAAALWALAHLGELGDKDLWAMHDVDGGVQEQGLLLFERRGPKAADQLDSDAAETDARSKRRVPRPWLYEQPLKLDGNGGRTQFQAVLTVQGVDGWVKRRPALPFNLHDPWMRVASFCVPPDQLEAMCFAAAEQANGRTPREPVQRYLRELAQLLAQHDHGAALAKLVETAEQIRTQAEDRPLAASLLLGYAEGLARDGKQLDALLAETNDSSRATVARMFNEALTVATHPQAGRDARVESLELLSFATGSSVRQALAALAVDLDERDLHAAAVRAIARQRAEGAGQTLLDLLTKTTGPARRAALDGLLASETRIALLLAAIEAGNLPPSEVDQARSETLRRHANADLRARAEKLWPPRSQAELDKARPAYLAALAGPNDPARGRELFRQHCGACHRVAEIGEAVGPDISELLGRTREQLLGDILEPSRAIDGAYANYLVITTDGRQHTGLIAAETDYILTLRQADNQQTPLLRREIERIQAAGASFMPDGFERSLDPQAMADLIGFLKEWRFLAAPSPRP